MGFEVDEDILQDFLVEASEILEQLSEQLVELEKRPDDRELLNAIFRGFHTVKGGAGFLSLGELVDVCHGAENVFDILRTGKQQISAELMDVILQALDTVNEMFGRVQNRDPLEPASPELLEALHHLADPTHIAKVAATVAKPAVVAPPAPVVPPPVVSTPVASTAGGSIDEITDDEFERLLDELHGPGKAPAVTAAASSSDATGDITDDEFEALLDQLHGAGKHVGRPDTPPVSAAVPPPLEPVSSPASAGDEITDDDFEKLLDQLHGQGKGPSASASASVSVNNEATASEPEQPIQEATPEITPKAAVSAQPQAQQQAVQSETTVRVDTRTLDVIMNMVGELVLVRNRLISLGVASNDEDLAKAVSNLDVVTADLQGAVMKTRMQPIKKVFGRFPRVVRDLARSLKKDIELIMEGEETDLDKNLVEALADPLVHLVRNSCDHGVELPEKREAAGKPRKGTITLRASQEGDHILLSITDDGAGMDPEKLKEIAISRGVLDPDTAARMSDTEAFNLIFAPGFSTKQQISDISGRGVGMDVVKTSITQLNGTINIHSSKGTGTRIEIKVPLTLAILPTLMVEVGHQTFALPLSSVNEIFYLNLATSKMVDGQLTIIVRDKAIPLFFLQEWLIRGGCGSRTESGHVVIVQVGQKQIGFVVDNLIGQEEVVIKPLDNLLHGTPGMAGATITSDGGIALILDIPGLLKHYARRR
ncbi:chemotaxis protein CheA [uncultured Tolumonas sp.]|uniref:chemotaxis protein CheA n=1 Tax=uncultured Tolumonas sp. TaxID=263765 RepID=UPI00292EFB41|nr:chemotaxis protein CheA [uncultured Tolumonas sp.]